MARPSTKRQAPKPPPNEEEVDHHQQQEEVVHKEIVRSVSTPALPGVIPEPPPMPTKPLHSNLATASTVPMRNTTTKQLVQPRPASFSDHHNGSYIESSFSAGQPIRTVEVSYTPLLSSSQDEVRKWTEKKGNVYNPRSSQVADEIIGSSKKVQQNFFTAAANLGEFVYYLFKESKTINWILYGPNLLLLLTHPKFIYFMTLFFFLSFFLVINKAEQLSFETPDPSSKLKKLSEKKFSFKKLFNKKSDQEDGSSCSSSFLDKEHEREILEREKHGRSMRIARPEIIHPVDFTNAKVEIIKITPPKSNNANAVATTTTVNNSSNGLESSDTSTTSSEEIAVNSSHIKAENVSTFTQLIKSLFYSKSTNIHWDYKGERSLYRLITENTTWHINIRKLTFLLSILWLEHNQKILNSKTSICLNERPLNRWIQMM